MCGAFKATDYYRYSNSTNFDVSYSLETEQLGTGGAIKNALPLIKNNFLLL